MVSELKTFLWFCYSRFFFVMSVSISLYLFDLCTHFVITFLEFLYSFCSFFAHFRFVSLIELIQVHRSSFWAIWSSFLRWFFLLSCSIGSAIHSSLDLFRRLRRLWRMRRILMVITPLGIITRIRTFSILRIMLDWYLFMINWLLDLSFILGDARYVWHWMFVTSLASLTARFLNLHRVIVMLVLGQGVTIWWRLGLSILFPRRLDKVFYSCLWLQLFGWTLCLALSKMTLLGCMR